MWPPFASSQISIVISYYFPLPTYEHNPHPPPTLPPSSRLRSYLFSHCCSSFVSIRFTGFNQFNQFPRNFFPREAQRPTPSGTPAPASRQLPRSQRRPAPDHRSCLKSPIIRHWNRINKRLNSPPWNNKYKHHQHNFSIIPLIISNNGKLNIFFLLERLHFPKCSRTRKVGGMGKRVGG